jgi:hypothetical protein
MKLGFRLWSYIREEASYGRVIHYLCVPMLEMYNVKLVFLQLYFYCSSLLAWQLSLAESANWSIHKGEHQTFSLTRSTSWWDGVCAHCSVVIVLQLDFWLLSFMLPGAVNMDINIRYVLVFLLLYFSRGFFIYSPPSVCVYIWPSWPSDEYKCYS